MAWDWMTFWIVILIGLLLLALVLTFLWFLDLNKKKKREPSHIQLYFDENFRNIIGEWDFSTRDRVKEFKKDITKRLTSVGGDIDILDTKRKKLDKRMDALEQKMKGLEGL
jgi:peptidoglycan hydrolase CwlO-like protein